jgi:hypothetical protein
MKNVKDAADKGIENLETAGLEKSGESVFSAMIDAQSFAFFM